MPRKVFVAGEILTAADVNTNLADQAVMVFDDSTARGSAIPSPSEGMVTYLKDTDALEKYTTAWEPVNTFGIVQTVQQTKTDTFSALLTPATISSDVFSVSITPTSASSKVIVAFTASAVAGSAEAQGVNVLLYRDGSVVTGAIGDAAGSRQRVTHGQTTSDLHRVASAISGFYIDSPATTSSVTYSLRLSHNSTSNRTVYLNRSETDSDATNLSRSMSNIVLMEVAV